MEKSVSKLKNRGSKNNFSDWVKSIFAGVKCCQKCGSNKNCSLHHIYSRISASMFNGILLCEDCHREADCFNRITGVKGLKFRQELLKISVLFWLKDDWWEDFISEKDKERNRQFFVLVGEDLNTIAVL